MNLRTNPSPTRFLALQTRGFSTAATALLNGRPLAHPTTPPSSRPTSHASSQSAGKRKMTLSSSSTKNVPPLQKPSTRSATRITSTIRCRRRPRRRCVPRRRRPRRRPGRKLRLLGRHHRVRPLVNLVSPRIPLLPPAPTSSSRTWTPPPASNPMPSLTPLICLAWLSRSSAAAARHPQSTTTLAPHQAPAPRAAAPRLRARPSPPSALLFLHHHNFLRPPATGHKHGSLPFRRPYPLHRHNRRRLHIHRRSCTLPCLLARVRTTLSPRRHPPRANLRLRTPMGRTGSLVLLTLRILPIRPFLMTSRATGTRLRRIPCYFR